MKVSAPLLLLAEINGAKPQITATYGLLNDDTLLVVLTLYIVLSLRSTSGVWDEKILRRFCCQPRLEKSQLTVTWCGVQIGWVQQSGSIKCARGLGFAAGHSHLYSERPFMTWARSKVKNNNGAGENLI
jgi:hypothetical protein